jgi:hypothetical protein
MRAPARSEKAAEPAPRMNAVTRVIFVKVGIVVSLSALIVEMPRLKRASKTAFYFQVAQALQGGRASNQMSTHFDVGQAPGINTGLIRSRAGSNQASKLPGATLRMITKGADRKESSRATRHFLTARSSMQSSIWCATRPCWPRTRSQSSSTTPKTPCSLRPAGQLPRWGSGARGHAHG